LKKIRYIFRWRWEKRYK